MNQLIDVFSSPTQSIAELMRNKKWLASLLIIVFVIAIVSFVTNPIVKAEMAKRMSDEQLDAFNRFASGWFTLIAVIFGAAFVVLGIAVATFFIYLFYKIAGAEGLYINYFSAMMAVSLIDFGLGKLVACCLIVMKKTMLVSTDLTIFVPNIDIKSFTCILLSQVDFFGVWAIVALALGIAAYAKIPVKKSLSIAAGYFVFKVAVMTPIIYISRHMFMR